MTRSLALAGALAVLAPAAHAAEGGAGFYLLGSRTINAGIVAPPGTYAQASLYAFSGSTSATVPSGGQLNVGLDAKAAIGFLTGLWAPETELAGGRPYLLVLLPYGWKQADVTATLALPSGPPLTGERSFDTTAFGDPAIGGGVGWGSGPGFASLNLLVNVPAGPYEDGSPTNIAFHHWSADLTGAYTRMWANGWQANAAAGVTWNWENPATDYTSGAEAHLEAAVAKGFGGWTAGVAGYHYQQVTGDSGAGALLGDYKGRTTGLGPTVGWTGAWGRQPIVLGASWFHEFDVKNRVPGDALFLNLTLPLGISARES